MSKIAKFYTPPVFSAPAEGDPVPKLLNGNVIGGYKNRVIIFGLELPLHAPIPLKTGSLRHSECMVTDKSQIMAGVHFTARD